MVSNLNKHVPTPCIKNCYIWFKLKLVASLQASEFPLEIPRSQNRNFPYKTTISEPPKKSETHFFITTIILKSRYNPTNTPKSQLSKFLLRPNLLDVHCTLGNLSTDSCGFVPNK